MSGFLLDTHAFIWLQRRDLEEVGSEFFAEVEAWQKQGRVYVSAISVWEIARLVSDSQLDLGQSVEEFVATGIEDNGLQLLELSVRIMI